MLFQECGDCSSGLYAGLTGGIWIGKLAVGSDIERLLSMLTSPGEFAMAQGDSSQAAQELNLSYSYWEGAGASGRADGGKGGA